jgi:predicted HTH domain antitoxin
MVSFLVFKDTTVRLPEEMLEDIEELSYKLQREKSEIIREALNIGINAMNLRLAIEQYVRGSVSFGRMAELTGLGHRELFLELRRRSIVYRYGEERFSEEIERLVD